MCVPKWFNETNCWSHWLHTTQPTPAPVAYVSTDPLPTGCKLLAANKSYLHPSSHYWSRKWKRMECQIHQRRAHAGTFWLFIVLSLHYYLSLKCQHVIWFFVTFWNDHNMNFCFKLHQSNFVPSRLNKMKSWQQHGKTKIGRASNGGQWPSLMPRSCLFSVFVCHFTQEPRLF